MSAEERTEPAKNKCTCENCKREFTPGANEWAVFCSYDCEYEYMLKHYGSAFLKLLR